MVLGRLTERRDSTKSECIFCSGMTATTIVQPIDLVKTRLQLSGQGTRGVPTVGFFKTFMGVIQRESFFGLYRGLTAALFRQVRRICYMLQMNHIFRRLPTPQRD